MEKVCTKCKTLYLNAEESFYKCKKYKDGLEYDCKICSKKRRKEYYDNNKEKVLKRHKVAREKYTKSNKYKEYTKAYYYKNREKILAKKRETYTRDLKTYFKGLISSTKQNAKNKNFEHNINRETLLKLYDSQKGKCRLTGVEMTYISGQGMVETNISVDRIDPSKGYTPDNIWLVCLQANQMKTNMTVKKLLEICKYILENVTVPFS